MTLFPAHNQNLSHPKYRPDIDGLRAVAIISVVWFHAFPNTIKAGFIGVDIFFVISGFLISSIIFENLENDRFSFIEFYSRRIKRIFPALLFVLFSCLIVAYCTFLFAELKQLNKEIAGGSAFIANFVFWTESGYFDSAAETKPLLHLWSLGIEEQFYIVWPLLLVAIWKSRVNPLIVTVVLLVTSFILNALKIRHHPESAFFLPHTRFWELLIGSVLAYLTLHKEKYRLIQTINNNTLLSNTSSILGALLIIAGILLTEKKSFPGWWAILPTFGAFFIISAGSHAWLNRYLLANRLMVFIGLISFPLYLWHWPLLSFATILLDEMPNEITRAGLVLAAIVLAWLTYKLVEKPLRFGKYSEEKTVALFVLLLITAVFSYCDYKYSFFSNHLIDERQDYLDYFENSLPEQKYIYQNNIFEKFRSECSFVMTSKPKNGKLEMLNIEKLAPSCYERDVNYKHSLFIWGDSQAQQLYFGLKTNLPSDWQILQVASFGCAPKIVTESSDTDKCVKSSWFALETIAKTKPEVVLIAQQGEHSIEKYNQFVAKLKSLGVKKVLLIGPVPHWSADLPKIIVKKLWHNTPQRTYQNINNSVLENNATIAKQFKAPEGAVWVNLIDFFCNESGCLTYIGNDKKTGITTWDNAHLTPMTSDYLAKNLLVKLIIDSQ